MPLAYIRVASPVLPLSYLQSRSWFGCGAMLMFVQAPQSATSPFDRSSTLLRLRPFYSQQPEQTAAFSSFSGIISFWTKEHVFRTCLFRPISTYYTRYVICWFVAGLYNTPHIMGMPVRRPLIQYSTYHGPRPGSAHPILFRGPRPYPAHQFADDGPRPGWPHQIFKHLGLARPIIFSKLPARPGPARAIGP